jgi:hypothetical protein
MAEVVTQKDGRTEQTQFECPTCGRSQLVTQRVAISHSRNGLMTDGIIHGTQHWLEKFG